MQVNARRQEIVTRANAGNKIAVQVRSTAKGISYEPAVVLNAIRAAHETRSMNQSSCAASISKRSRHYGVANSVGHMKEATKEHFAVF